MGVRGGRSRKEGTDVSTVKIMQSSIAILEKTGCNSAPVVAIRGANSQPNRGGSKISIHQTIRDITTTTTTTPLRVGPAFMGSGEIQL